MAEGKSLMKMLSIAVCDDEIIECCHMAGKIREILEEMKMLCLMPMIWKRYVQNPKRQPVMGCL